MKIRQGFISNSSSSSFVVKYRWDWLDLHANKVAAAGEQLSLQPDPLTPQQVEALLKYKFWFSKERHPSHLEVFHNEDYPLEVKEEEAEYLVYQQACNEDDTIAFLLGHKIGFKAACHYNHYSVFYCPENDQVVRIDNPGIMHETYGGIDNTIANTRGTKIYTREQWLEENRYNPDGTEAEEDIIYSDDNEITGEGNEVH